MSGLVTLRSSVGPRHGVACSRYSVVEREVLANLGLLRCGEGLRHRSVAVLRRCVALFIAWQILVFCFVLLFHYFEDLSTGKMRIL